MNKFMLVIIGFIGGILISGIIGYKLSVSLFQASHLAAAKSTSDFLEVFKSDPDKMVNFIESDLACNMENALKIQKTIWGYKDASSKARITEIKSRWGNKPILCHPPS